MRLSYRIDVSALDAFKTAVARFDDRGTLTYVNRAAARLLHCEAADHVHLSQLFVDDEARKQVLAELEDRLTGNSSTYRTNVRPFGAALDVPISVFALPDSDEDGQPLGSFALIDDLREEEVRDRMHRIIEQAQSVDDLLGPIGDEMRALFEFDELRVTAISGGRKHLRTLFSDDRARGTRYPFRWWPMPPFILETFEKETPRVIDIDELFSDPRYGELLARDPAMQTFRDSGVQEILSLPVMEGNQIVGFFALDTRRKGTYDPAALKRLQRLPIAEAVAAAVRIEERQRQQTLFNLLNDLLSHSHDVKGVAETLVQQLSDCFGWEHVAIFQNDERRDLVKLVCQSARDGYGLPAGFFLPRHISKPWRDEIGSNGAIARSALTGLRVDIPDTKQATPGLYVEGVPGIGSEIVIPVPGDPVRWILNVESTLTNAFAEEEIDLLRMVADEAGSVLQRSALLERQTAVLGSINDAVIETDTDGRLRWCNVAAHAILGLVQEDLATLSIADLAEEGALRSVLKTTASFSHRETSLIRRDGRTVPVLLLGATLPEHLDGRVYVASDLTVHKELQRLAALKEVFRHAAMEGRVPLALASSWLEQSARQFPDTRAMVDKVLSQLGRADLPLERLLRLSETRSDEKEDGYADIRRAVEVTLRELPDSLRDDIDLQSSAEFAPVNCGFGDLQFCVESLLSFGLRTKPLSKRLNVTIAQTQDRAILSVVGDWVPDLGSSENASTNERWRRKTLKDLTLGQSVIEGIARRSGGRFRSMLDRELALELTLPLRSGDSS